jgi:hypothetical protein
MGIWLINGHLKNANGSRVIRKIYGPRKVKDKRIKGVDKGVRLMEIHLRLHTPRIALWHERLVNH